MLGKRTRPRPANITKPGARYSFPETLNSPKCCLEYRILSPRSLKASDQVASGIGLGIVAALEKEKPSPPVVCESKISRSNPIPINIRSNKNTDEMESYTYVTCRRPENQFNKVYCDKAEVGGAGHDRRTGCSEDMTWRSSGVFYESPPPRLMNPALPTLDFLSWCYLCKKNLHGSDIYMYRGEKAFCSTECRCKQIATDERKDQFASEVAKECKEKCGSEVSKSFDISNSPYTRENIFFTGIIAA